MNNENMNGTGQEEKLFTQEEVNEIVRKRLYERKQAQKAEGVAFDDAVSAAVEKATAERRAELDARESKIVCREYLLEKGLSADLLDVFPTSDPAIFREKIEKLSGVELARKGYPHIVDAGEAIHPPTPQRYTQAFSRNGSKHKPKKYNPSKGF